MLKFWKEHDLINTEREKKMNDFAEIVLITPRA